MAASRRVREIGVREGEGGRDRRCNAANSPALHTDIIAFAGWRGRGGEERRGFFARRAQRASACAHVTDRSFVSLDVQSRHGHLELS